MRRLRLAAVALVAAAGSLVAPVGSPVAPTAHALPDGLAPTPPLGFNNWNATQCGPGFTEEMVKATADLFVSRGLRDAGYRYVNVDDCWALPTRGPDGNLRPDPARFPGGIKAVADYVHAKGLKFGIYTSAGTRTCSDSGFPGALGHEQQDADLFASWGVDYLKYDNCHNQGVDARQRYRTMRDALRRTGRPIVFSLCEWGHNRPWEWASDTGHLWRTTGDITDTWDRTVAIYEENVLLDQYASPGNWNDPDMLEVGNGGMTPTEYRSHFSLWSIMAAPLLIGTDLRAADAGTFEILTNRDVLAVDQDVLGVQGRRIRSADGVDVIVKPLAGGDKAVALFNKNADEATVETSLSEIGFGPGAYRLTDLWSKEARTTTGGISASVPGHGTVLYRVTRTSVAKPPAAGVHDLSKLTPQSITNGFGPVEVDRSNGELPGGDGGPLTIGGVVHARGLGAHANSGIEYHVGGRCTRLTASVGVDDEVGPRGSVVFQVFADARKVADSGRLTGDSPGRPLTAMVSGANVLRLVVSNAGDGSDFDHADWGSPRLTCV
ncbi:NPCBM/NEW2 domain-containing protein [Saccharothrix australiensis]|uniref:Alpha-galactosidase n=1 Tax=Saccharothrix australiensis TaxID=2072 RepID=A0A495VU49_9PSEU|nr:NPCBM/NEW2 domain-containing protein [Saccharothrix australiensis]RKT52921.1 alpha-galactosidase [Saccharothrix australiensis]